jgi:hypothetical protein
VTECRGYPLAISRIAFTGSLSTRLKRSLRGKERAQDALDGLQRRAGIAQRVRDVT